MAVRTVDVDPPYLTSSLTLKPILIYVYILILFLLENQISVAFFMNSNYG